MKLFQAVAFVLLLSAVLAVGCGDVKPKITQATPRTQVQAGKSVNETDNTMRPL